MCVCTRCYVCKCYIYKCYIYNTSCIIEWNRNVFNAGRKKLRCILFFFFSSFFLNFFSFTFMTVIYYKEWEYMVRNFNWLHSSFIYFEWNIKNNNNHSIDLTVVLRQRIDTRLHEISFSYFRLLWRLTASSVRKT